MAQDFYEVLGVERSASSKEIQAAYRRLARRYHPDVTGGDKAAEERFKAANEAHEVLSDDKKRAAYDRWGDQWLHADQLLVATKESLCSAEQRCGPGGAESRYEYFQQRSVSWFFWGCSF